MGRITSYIVAVVLFSPAAFSMDFDKAIAEQEQVANTILFTLGSEKNQDGSQVQNKSYTVADQQDLRVKLIQRQ